MTSPYRYAQAIKRGDHYKAQARALAREVAALKKQLDERYADGSSHAFGMTFAALGDELCLIQWLRQRLNDPDAPLRIPAEVEDLIVEDLLVEKAKRRGRVFDAAADLKFTPPTKLFTA